MMKRQKSIAIVGLLAASLGCSSNSYTGNNDGFVAGACAIGAALFGVAGAVALADWCFSETDEQMISRITSEYRTIYAEHHIIVDYFERITGADPRLLRMDKPFVVISEATLHDFATYIWHTNSTQRAYRSRITSAQSTLTSASKQLWKRINALKSKHCNYKEQQLLNEMTQLICEVEKLLIHVRFVAYSLEYHKTYFNLYDSIDTIRNRYLNHVNIFESGRYSVPAELKYQIANDDHSGYALRNFVINIESDIATLKSDVRALVHHYPEKKRYTNGFIDLLSNIKNIIVNDPCYKQEVYEWEQARLQQLQLEAFKAQARAERERAHALQEQNRILQERNRIEREKLYRQECMGGHMCDAVHYQEPVGNIDVTLNFTI